MCTPADEFGRLQRLHTLLLNNNHVNNISPTIATQLPNLACLILTNNKITLLSEIDALKGCSKLTMLSLIENPISRQQHYRLYVIHTIPRSVSEIMLHISICHIHRYLCCVYTCCMCCARTFMYMCVY